MIGMRLPKNSEHLSDSTPDSPGEKDKVLLLALTKAGRDHRKALRMVHVQALINAPIGWWIQYDTYKVGTVANSRSRMHKMGSRLLTKEDFHVKTWGPVFQNTLEEINLRVVEYQRTKDEGVWREIIDILPMSYLQERAVDLNYEVLLNILSSRYNERLKDEWRCFCDAFMVDCPLLSELWEATK
jgi:hypothetical protein